MRDKCHSLLCKIKTFFACLATPQYSLIFNFLTNEVNVPVSLLAVADTAFHVEDECDTEAEHTKIFEVFHQVIYFIFHQLFYFNLILPIFSTAYSTPTPLQTK